MNKCIKGKSCLHCNTDYCRFKTENEKLKEQIIRLSEENGNLIIRANTSYNNYRDTQRRLDELCKANIHNLALLSKANKTLQEIKKIAEDGLQSICYKANCATCRCYSKKISNDTLENIINDYFVEDGDFTDTEGDFFEVLQAFIDRERAACNKAQPISEKILDIITKAKEQE